MRLEPSYPILTERLELRPLGVEDAVAVNAYESLPEVCAYVPFEPRSLETTTSRLADAALTRTTLDGEGQPLRLGIVVRETGELVGEVLLFLRSIEHRGGELGYIMHPAHHGRGFATEAARAVLELAFHGPWTPHPLRRVTARIDTDNEPSAAVLRRLGMRQEAVLVENEWFKGRWSTEVDFAILDREWGAGLASGS
jgi:RimJ/RimL family protein N-acetyltransferase